MCGALGCHGAASRGPNATGLDLAHATTVGGEAGAPGPTDNPLTTTSSGAAVHHEIETRLLSFWGRPDAALGDYFELEIVEKRSKYLVTLTAGGVSGAKRVATVSKRNGDIALARYEPPQGRALTGAELASVEQVLRRQGAFLMVVDSNGTLLRVETPRGIVDIGPPGELESRWHDGRAVLYWRHWRGPDQFAAFAVDIAGAGVVEARRHDLSPNDNGLIGAAEMALVDEALRREGDFGPYGDVTAGLEALSERFVVEVKRTDDALAVSVSSRDGHGHTLDFSVSANGEIQDMTAGHEAPRPPLDAPRQPR